MLKMIITNKIIYLERLKKQATSLLLIRRIEDKINVLVDVLKEYEGKTIGEELEEYYEDQQENQLK